MNGMIGLVLALSLALVGCEQRSTQQGGGGGGPRATPTAKAPEQAAKTAPAGQTGPELIKQAANKAEDARAMLAHNDLNGAARGVEAARDLVGQARDKAPASLQPKLSNIEQEAALAQANLIDNDTTNDVPSTDALAKSLKEMVASEPKVWGGGGKPMPLQ